jgi:hypothetical protein
VDDVIAGGSEPPVLVPESVYDAEAVGRMRLVRGGRGCAQLFVLLALGVAVTRYWNLDYDPETGRSTIPRDGYLITDLAVFGIVVPTNDMLRADALTGKRCRVRVRTQKRRNRFDADLKRRTRVELPEASWKSMVDEVLAPCPSTP